MILLSQKHEIFKEIYDKNRKLVYGIVKKYLNDFNNIDDVCQSIWMSVFEIIDKLAVKSDIDTRNYISAVARYRAISFNKKQIKEFETMSAVTYLEVHSLNASTNPVEETIIAEDDTPSEKHLIEALKKLNILDKQLLIFKYRMNMTSEEMGNLVGESAANVRQRLSRTKKYLKKEISKNKRKEDELYEKY